MTKNLKKALQIQKKTTQQSELQIQGTLGIPIGGQKTVDVPQRNSFVYVRLRDNQNEVVQAFNNKVAASYGLPVFVQRINNRYEVLGVNTSRYQNNWNSYAPYLPRHGTSHSFSKGNGGDITWIYSQQFMPMLVYPSAQATGTNVTVASHPLLDNNNVWKMVGGTGTPNFLNYIPTGGNDAIMGLVYMDVPTGNPKLIINSGTPFSSFLTGTADIYRYIPAPTDLSTQIPLAAIRIVTGTSTIDWNNIYDVRQFLHTVPTGTSGGGGGSSVDTIGFAGLYNGTPLGTGTFLNVRSPSGQALFTISGSMFDLFVTGSTGGGTNPPVTGTMVIQQEGQTLGSVPILNFTDGLYASISGSVAQILLSGTMSTYVRTGQPTSLSSITGTYWIVPDRIFVTGSLAVFNQGHALIPGIDYVEQYANSGTFQYISTPPTGTYNLSIYGVPVSTINGGGGGGGGVSQSYLGYNTIGGSTDTPGINNKVYAKKITLTTAKLLTSIGAYVGTAGGTAEGPSVAVYTDNSGPDKLIAGVPGLGILINPSSGFRWVELPVGVWLTAGDYWIVVRTTDLGGAAVCQIKYDSGGSDKTGNMGAAAWYDWSNVGSVSTTTNSYSIRANVIS